MNSNKDSITESFGESIAKNTIDTSIDTAEIVLDSFMDDGILKEIPIIKYAVTACFPLGVFPITIPLPGYEFSFNSFSSDNICIF